MLHHSGLAVNVLFEACAFFLSDLTLKVRGTFVTDIFVKAVTESGRIVRIEFTPNMPPTPLVHGLEGGTRRVLPGEPPLVVEDLSVAVAVAEAEVHPNLPRLLQNDNTEILRVRTAGWAIEATARPIQRSATRGKKQVDLSFAPLRDPLAPNPKTGKVVAPHGLVGQSFDGDDIAVDGKKDRYRELWWRQSSFKANEITTEAQAEGAIEGSGGDYKVGDFFGTDFKYRRFDALEAAPRSIAALSGTKRVVANAGANGAASWKRSKAGTSGDDAQAFEAVRKQQP